MFKEYENSVHQCVARLTLFPSYYLKLNPIKVCFGQLKRLIQKYVNFVFPLYPTEMLKVTMHACTNEVEHDTLERFRYFGYNTGDL